MAVACDPDPLAIGHVWFEEVTEQAGLGFLRQPAEGYGTIADRMSGGVCVLDADGRPPLDLFFPIRPGSGGTRSRLFVARGPFDYADETDARGLGETGDANGCLAFDTDGDGDEDLLVTGAGSLRLFLREGARFVEARDRIEARIGATEILMSAAAGDLDGDGDLDLVVAGFVDSASLRPGDCGGLPCPLDLYLARPIPSRLLVNEGGRFIDRTASLAPDLLLAEPTLVHAIVDLEGTGWPGIFVGNDLGGVYHDRWLVRDKGGVFRDRAAERGLSTDASGDGVDTMGIAIGDVDGDGHLDLAQTAFEGRHSPLFLCRADGRYEERGRALGLGAVADTLRWGNALADLDLDGDLDLFEAAGHVFLEDEGASRGLHIAHEQAPNLFVGRGDGSFVRVIAEPEDAVGRRWPARGIAIADLDDDGRLDVVLGTSRGAPVLLRNVRAREGHFVRIVLRGRPPNTGAVGARVEVSDGVRTRVRVRVAGEGYLGSHDARLHLGLPLAGPIEIRTRWPSGALSVVSLDGVDREVVLHEP